MSTPLPRVVHSILRLTVAAAISLLIGCISVFPKAEPTTLYRFGGSAPTARVSAAEGPQFGVALMATGFDRAAATDRILTVTGTQVSYIKGARWATSPAALFDTALQRAFDADPGPAQLVEHGEASKIEYVLNLDIRTFEARYDKGQDLAPTIVVELHGVLDLARDRIAVSERNFKSAVGADDNRVDAIAQAFDRAVGEVLVSLVDWVNARGENADRYTILLPSTTLPTVPLHVDPRVPSVQKVSAASLCVASDSRLPPLDKVIQCDDTCRGRSNNRSRHGPL